MDVLKNLQTIDLDCLLMTYISTFQMVKDVEDFAETDEFGIEMKEQATIDAQELRSNFEKLT